MTSKHPARVSFASVALVAVLLVGALSLRLHRVGDRSLWEDELSTWTSIRGTIMDGIRYVQMPHPPLYSLSCRLSATGNPRPSETQLRLPAAIYGTLAVFAGGWLGSVLYGRRLGAAMLCVLAVNAFLVRYSREARMYSLLVLTATLSTTFWVLLVMRTRRRGLLALGYVLSTTAMLYTHYFAALILPAQGLWQSCVRSTNLQRYAHAKAWSRDDPSTDMEPLRTGVNDSFLPRLAMGAAVLLFAPLAMFFVRNILPNKLGWIHQAPAGAYVQLLGELTAGVPQGVMPELRVAATWIEWALGLLACACLIWGWLPLRCKQPEHRPIDGAPVAEVARPGLLLCLWVGCVVGGLGIVSLTFSPVFVPRYAISALIPVSLAVLAAAQRLKPTLLVPATAALVACNLAAVGFERIVEPPRPNGLAFIIDHLNRSASASDAVVVIDFPFCPNYRNPVEMGFQYYGLRSDIAVLRMRGEQKSGAIVEHAALGDARNLHIVTLLGDVEPALQSSGRPFSTFLAAPYRYFIVDGLPGTPPPAPILGP
ncbi:MAG: glycosyltransferase family 39 protein [Phycisphaerales bacterium]|nr:glycosyltransferase family 39 protein [Phycisphaerales bacterium]